jgi:glycosyltransferase involved in cell wall biosynthesis
MNLSVVVPLYNEQDNVRLLHEELDAVLPGMNRPYEIVLVNDGSTDDTEAALDALAARDPHVTVIHFRRNFGQTAALAAGLDHASGEIIVTLDGDLQNDPRDIPALVAKLEEGYDLVHGYRLKRRDAFFTRRVPSRIANWLIARATRFPVRDLGCTLKAMRRETARDLKLYGELHRFIPILAHAQGARCCEVVTNHRPRRFGQAKYGLSRTLRVLLDLATVVYLIQYFISPMRLFGLVGLGCGALSVLTGLATVAMKLGGCDITGNPLLYVCLFAGMVAVQFASLGMIGEMCTRIYYESRGTRPYAIRRLVNFSERQQRRQAA